jgi:hypothetical protein
MFANPEIHTPLFNLDFKSFDIGDTSVVGGRGALPTLMLDAIADKLCVRIASLRFGIEAAIFGSDAVRDRKSLKPSACFDDTGEILQEYAAKMQETAVMTAELDYAELLAMHETVRAMQASAGTHWPNHKIQYAYVGASSRATGFKQGRIERFVDAVEYRYKSLVLNAPSAKKAVVYKETRDESVAEMKKALGI